MYSLLKYSWLIVLLLLAVLPLIYIACTEPIFVYDEAYNYIAAYEWIEHQHYFIDFDSKSPLKNTKPYLFIYLQGVLGKLSNWNLFFLRLPTLLSFAAILGMQLYLLIKKINSTYWAVLSVMLLIWTPFWTMPHLNFTGDHDIPLTMFLLSYLFLLYIVVEYEFISVQKNKLAFWIPVCAALSILTKGWVITFFLPASLLYLVSRRKLTLFQNAYLWLGISLSIIMLLSWYLGREAIDPGYLDAVWKYEINRFSNNIGNVHPEFSYYWKLIFVNQLGWPCIGLLYALVQFFKEKSRLTRQLLLFVILHAVLFVFLFSFSKVKLDWYMAPVIPLIMLSVSYGWSALIQDIITMNEKNKMAIVVVLTSVTMYYITQALTKTFQRFQKETFFTLVQDNFWNTHGRIVYTDFNPSLLYYTRKMGRDEKTLSQYATSTYVTGDTIIYAESIIGLGLQRKYDVQELSKVGSCTVIKIKGVKN